MQYEKNLRTAIVNERSSGYRVVCIDSYFETQHEFFFSDLETAEDFAKGWIENGNIAYQ